MPTYNLSRKRFTGQCNEPIEPHEPEVIQSELQNANDRFIRAMAKANHGEPSEPKGPDNINYSPSRLSAGPTYVATVSAISKL